MAQDSFTNTQHSNITENKPKEEKKKSKLSIDHDNDWVFLKNWPPIIRWLLVVPMGLFFFLIMQLTVGFVGNKLMESLNIGFLNIIIIAIVTLAKFMAFEVGMVAAAPVKRESKVKTGILLAIIPLGVLAFLMTALISINANPDAYEVYYPASHLIAQIAGGALGIIWGIYCLRADTEGRTKELEASESIEKIGEPE